MHLFGILDSSFQGFFPTSVSSLGSVSIVLGRYDSSVSTGMSASSFFVSVFPVCLLLTGSSAKVAVRFSVDDFFVNRFFTEVSSCVSVRCSPLLELEAPGVIVVSDGSLASLCLPLTSLWVHPSHLHAILALQVEEQEGSAAGGMSNVVSVVFRHLLEGFLLTSCARRVVVRFAISQLTPSSVLTRCSSARSLWPSHTCQPASARGQPASARDSQIPFPPLEGEQAQIHQTPALLHDTDHPLHDRLVIVHRCSLNRGMSQAACRTIPFISALSVVGLYCVRS